MARKVFISVLGTGFYGKCQYVTSEFVSSETRYIQQATLEMLTRDGEWDASDEILILLTSKAKITNWCVEGNKRVDFRREEQEYVGLRDELCGMKLLTPVSTLDIPDGKDEKEIWQIFDILYGALQEGDELYFDLTHGFRYLPMLVLVLGNYSKFLKKTRIKSITYGNYESRNMETNHAPFVDITPLATLQEWTVAAADYLNHGDADGVSKCCDIPLKPIRRKTKGKDEAANLLCKLSEKLATLCEDIRYNRGLAIVDGKEADFILKNIELADASYIKPLVPLLGHIRESVEGFGCGNPMNMIRVARLCSQHGNYQAAVTWLQEGIVTVLCSKYGMDYKKMSSRETIGRVLSKRRFCEEGNPDKYQAKGIKEIDEKVEEIYTDAIFSSELVTMYTSLSETRNDVNHAAMRDKEMKSGKIKKSIEAALEKAFNLFDATNCDVAVRPPMLVNLSNHPYAEWSEEQKEAAKAYGECRDILFPAIPADADSAEIASMAERYIEEILDQNKRNEVTVHVMGEMAFTHYVVSGLLDSGIPCICSTSERLVCGGDDGEKIVRFQFKRFREYID